MKLFQWDSNKAASNKVKHGVTFDEATSVFKDGNRKTVVDNRQDYGETRNLTAGKSFLDRLLFVVSTERPPDTRIISARKFQDSDKKFFK